MKAPLSSVNGPAMTSWPRSRRLVRYCRCTGLISATLALSCKYSMMAANFMISPHFFPSPLSSPPPPGGGGWGGGARPCSYLPPTLTLPRKGGGKKRARGEGNRTRELQAFPDVVFQFPALLAV